MRKSVFGVSDQAQHKPGCTATEDGLRLEISDLRRIFCTIYVLKTKALISCAVTCVRLFSHMQKSGFLTTWLISKYWSTVRLVGRAYITRSRVRISPGARRCVLEQDTSFPLLSTG